MIRCHDLRFTYNVDQHGALLRGTNTSGHGDNHQADCNDDHEGRRRKKVVIHENAEVIENR